MVLLLVCLCSPGKQVLEQSRMTWSHFNNKQSTYEKNCIRNILKKQIISFFSSFFLKKSNSTAVVLLIGGYGNHFTTLLLLLLFNFFYNTLPHECHLAVKFPTAPTLISRLKEKSEGTALSFSTRLLHSLLKQSLVKCCEQMLLYLVGLKLFLIAATHLPQTSGRARGNLRRGVEDGQLSCDLAVPPGGSVIISSKGINS